MNTLSLIVAVLLALSPTHGAQDAFPAYLETIEYPILAIQARISGTVELEITIAPDGTVSRVRGISGHNLLVRAAEEGIKRWRFLPRCSSRKQMERMVIPLRVKFVLEGETEYRPRARLRYVYPDSLIVIAENLHWQPLVHGHSADAGKQE